MGRYATFDMNGGMKLPSSIGNDGQILGVTGNVLGFIDPSTVKKLTANPATTTVANVGEAAINTATGELFICTYKNATGATRWVGESGTMIGYPVGQSAWFGATSATFTVPAGVNFISVVLVGAGGGGHYSWANPGGGGGALAYVNAMPVTPGEALSVVVGSGGGWGSHGGDTYIDRGATRLFTATGGKYSCTSESLRAKPVSGAVTVGGGGAGGMCSANGYGGGGGAGGYGFRGDGMDACGGDGLYGFPDMSGSFTYGASSLFGVSRTYGYGANGAGAGGTGYQSSTYSFTGGGGVGLHGRGSDGVPQLGNGNSFYGASNTMCAQGGSGGMGSMNNNSSQTLYMENPDGSMRGVTRYHGQGGLIGGGGAGGGTSVSGSSYFCWGGDGGARIVWGRQVDWAKGGVIDLPTSNGVV